MDKIIEWAVVIFIILAILFGWNTAVGWCKDGWAEIAGRVNHQQYLLEAKGVADNLDPGWTEGAHRQGFQNKDWDFDDNSSLMETMGLPRSTSLEEVPPAMLWKFVREQRSPK
jgi:hypothetical protein